MAQKEYSRVFGNFRGIDVTSELGQVADARFTYAENMYKDYESGQGMSVETFPGHRLLTRFKDASIYGLYMYKSINDSRKYIVVHAGKRLYRFPHDERDNICDLTPIYSDMEEKHSTGFLFNNRLYILDSKNYVCIDEDGNAENVGEDNAYVPTTYSNGLEYEQRNMLTNKFKERYFSTEYSNIRFVNSEYSFSTIMPVYDYGIFEEGHYRDNGYLSVEVHVPVLQSEVSIDFTKHFAIYPGEVDAEGNVTRTETREVEDAENYEDSKTGLYAVRMTDSVKVINGTFDGCTNLHTLFLSNNITELPDRFFAGTALETIYLPKNLKSLGADAFNGCTKLKAIYTPKGIAYDFPEDVEIKRYDEYSRGIPTSYFSSTDRTYSVYTPCKEVERVTLGGIEIPRFEDVVPKAYEEGKDALETFYYPIYEEINGESFITHIVLNWYEFRNSLNDNESYIGSIGVSESEIPEEYKLPNDLVIEGIAKDGKFVSATKKLIATENKEDFDDTDKSAKGSNPDYKGTSKEAINNCNVTTVFDDRIFFTGNENLPNTVFYTQRDQTGHTNPTYVGVLNYLNDGVGNVRNSAMMASATMLMVLKGDTAQDGSIFYHTAQSTDNDITPRIYPSVEGVPGLGCTGVAVNFRDDCVFLSKRGLEAVAKQTVNLERTVQHRSTNIDALFKGKDLTKARAAEWCGYLLILIDGELYLADSRQMFEGIGGTVEYEWYYCKDIGDYVGDNDKYYTERPLKPLDEGICVYDGRIAVDYNSVYGREGMQYAEIDGINYFVAANAYETEDGKVETEKENGTLNNATEILCVDDVLYFGTPSGAILCLNNDKRDAFGRIPEERYNRCGHAYPSILQLKLDNAGVPYYTKNTVKRSPTFNLKPFINSSVKISVSTDRAERALVAEQSNNILDFKAVDFSNDATQQSQRSIFVIKERTKKWVEKQYDISSERHNAPFGIYSLAYRYEIAGRIKK